MSLSPVEVRFLLHCHAIIGPFENSPIKKGMADSFITSGVIEPTDEGCYVTTPLGAAWCKAICAVPMPKQAFVDANGKVIQ